jgi:hypothetical protein
MSILTIEQKEGIKAHYQEMIERCERVNKAWELKKKKEKEPKPLKKKK